MKDPISIKRVEALHPRAVNIFKAFIDDAEKTLNTTFRVAQGFRTFEEQQAIYNQPHDKKDNDGDGKIDESDERVSDAPAGKSFHNYGIAVDLVEMVNGKPNWQFNYAKLKPIAQKYGIEWGGDWKKPDRPHFQFTFGYDITKLYQKYLRKDFIPGNKYINL